MPVFGVSKIQGSHRITIDRDNMPNSGRSKNVQSAQLSSTMKMNPRQSIVQNPVEADTERGNANQQLLKYQKDLLQIMSKFAANHTVLKGIEELREFMANEVTENDRMMTLLNSFTDFNVHTKIT